MDSATEATPVMQAAPAMEDRELVLHFESIGDNCELGLVQRRAGAEPLGLLRFAGAPLRSFLRALAADLLDWRMMRQQIGLIRQFDLTREYLTILWVIDRGGEAQHVASELDISIGAVYRLFRKINEKMDCRHIRASAHKAKQLGLLGGYIPN